MKNYTLQAKLDSQITTCSVSARDDFSAKVLATQKINANYVSDKRYSVGEITLKNPDGKVVWTIKEENSLTAKKEKKEVN